MTAGKPLVTFPVAHHVDALFCRLCHGYTSLCGAGGKCLAAKDAVGIITAGDAEFYQRYARPYTRVVMCVARGGPGRPRGGGVLVRRRDSPSPHPAPLRPARPGPAPPRPPRVDSCVSAACPTPFPLRARACARDAARYPFFADLVESMAAAVRGDAAVPRLSITAAHDTVLMPLLVVLGASDGRWPPYAARLVFEVWRAGKARGAKGGADAERTAYVRLLYHGQDVTGRLACSLVPDARNGFCTLATLRAQVQGLLAPFGTYDEACRL
jgi:hypothetical protein